MLATGMEQNRVTSSSKSDFPTAGILLGLVMSGSQLVNAVLVEPVFADPLQEFRQLFVCILFGEDGRRIGTLGLLKIRNSTLTGKLDVSDLKWRRCPI